MHSARSLAMTFATTMTTAVAVVGAAGPAWAGDGAGADGKDGDPPVVAAGKDGDNTADDGDGEAVPDGADDAATKAAIEDVKKAKKKAKEAEERKTGDTIDVTGRVYTRVTMSSEESAPWQSELGLESARIGFDYQWREKLRVKVSYEAASDSIRDAYVELELGHGLRLRAGRMKVPVGMIERTSSWTLPTVGRGMVRDILKDGLQLTGRRNAAVVRWRHESGWRPTLEVAASQQTDLIGDEQLGLVKDGAGLNVFARAEASSPCRMYTFAIHAANRAVDINTALRRYSSAGLEAEVDLEPIARGLRAWGDAVVGQSQLAATQLGETRTSFAALHAIAGYRLGGLDRNEAYVEPFVGAGWFDPVLDRSGDEVSEVVVGLGGGIWKRWRAHAQLSYQNAKQLRPPNLAGELDVNDKLTVTAQLGAAL